jgi:hypothetical protein
MSTKPSFFSRKLSDSYLAVIGAYCLISAVLGATGYSSLPLWLRAAIPASLMISPAVALLCGFYIFRKTPRLPVIFSFVASFAAFLIWIIIIWTRLAV